MRNADTVRPQLCPRRRLALFLICAGFIAGIASSTPVGAAVSSGWSPAAIRLVVVGVLRWKSADLSPFSVKNRRDKKLVNFFKNAGVPEDQIVYLNNESATLPNVMAALKSEASQAKPGDTFLFYYCGHGWLDDHNNGYLANYDAGATNKSCLSARDIANTLKNNFKGSQLIVLADCCCSGSLAEALKAANPPFKYGVLTSSVTSQTSTENWTFSQSVLDTLKGHAYADENRDGVITFDELGSYIKHEMKQLEEQDATVDSGNGFDRGFVFATVRDPGERAPENVEVKYEGDWWKAKLLEVKDGQAKVHWLEIGWDSASDDVFVPLSDVRPLGARSVREKNRTANPASAAQKPTSAGDSLIVGTKVKVLYEGDYYPATIVKVNGSRYLVHYQNYESSDDEWVETGRIK